MSAGITCKKNYGRDCSGEWSFRGIMDIKGIAKGRWGLAVQRV